MRKLVCVLFGLFISSICFSQDLIIKKNGDEISVKVMEITTDLIKYKNYNFQDGPLRSISQSDVYMIVYENGEKEKFGDTQKTTANEQVSYSYQPVEVEREPEVESERKYKGNQFTIGTGYGNSYGGAGMRVQMRVGGNVGFGFHAGVGYFPDAPVLASAGIKFFVFRNLYINAQYGLTGWEHTWSSYDYWDSSGGSYSYDYDEGQLLHGPSLLTGGDWTWGSKIGFGFNAAIGVTYNVNTKTGSDFVPALDLGFLVRF